MNTTLAKHEPRSMRPREFFPSIREEFEGLWSRLIGDRMELPFLTPTTPPMDLRETDKEFKVEIDVPGFKAEDIKVQLCNNVLTVTGDRADEKKEDGATFHRLERRSGSFSRSMTLPSPVAEQKVEAKYRNGVLAIVMPKAVEPTPLKIKIGG